MTAATRGQVGQSTITYSPQRGWVTRIKGDMPSNAFLDLSYSRDAAGRITDVDGNQTDEDWHYVYDDLDRLVCEEINGVRVDLFSEPP